MSDLGRLVPVDLRQIWSNESRDFTPWLAQPENLELLGVALGMDLQLEAQEKDVGPFRADLLCKNTAEDDSWVVIENQIERTDHRHLGQLLTYASGLHAKTIVWISGEFTEEHRAAFDWLNRIANRSAQFFGIEVELWKIGNSPAAPRFNVVCKPNEWEATAEDAKEAIEADEGNRSQRLRVRYWSAFRDFLYLKEHKEDIERALGDRLDWREMPDKKASRIVLFRSADGYQEDTWPEQFAWLKDKLESFDRVFRPLLTKDRQQPIGGD